MTIVITRSPYRITGMINERTEGNIVEELIVFLETLTVLSLLPDEGISSLKKKGKEKNIRVSCLSHGVIPNNEQVNKVCRFFDDKLGMNPAITTVALPIIRNGIVG